MQIRLEDQLLERYPNTCIGYLTAKVSVKKSDPYVDALKSELKTHLDQKGIHATNFAVHPDVAVWRQIYEENFKVKAKTYRSSIESLLRRVVTGKDIWNICNVVDLYNCCSILSLLPMGGYDLDKIAGDITIRHGKEPETFLGLGEMQRVEVKSNHVVYADDKKVICWLWNHKDARETCIDENSKNVIFFIDSFDLHKVQKALCLLEDHLEKALFTPLEKGILHRGAPCT